MSGLIFDGDGDVYVTGVVRSKGPDDQNWSYLAASGTTETVEGTQHYGHGEVWVTDKQVHGDADGS